MSSMNLLSICGALAAGEFLAALASTWADAWPVAALLAAPVALFGYGLRARAWPVPFFFFLGIALFLLAAAEDEQFYRERPWMRGQRRRTAQAGPGPLASEIRRDFSRRIAFGIEGDRETVSLSRAILLGERRRLSPETKRLFVESGTMHVFAISGLHVMAISSVLTCLLALVLVPRRFAGLVAAPLLWGYVLLIGAPPSAIRAVTMATFSCLAPVFWRKPDGLRAWALTFLTVHLVRPRLVADVGNALSFAVMLAIVLAGRWTQDRPKWQQAATSTVAAWAIGVPIAAYVFGRVTPGGMLANLVLLGAAKLTVVTGAIGLFCTYLSEAVSAHFANLSALAIRAMVFVADAVARLPGANFETGRWTFGACATWYAGLVVFVWAVRRLAKAFHNVI